MTFKPEFLNRIDEIVFFNNLDKDAIYKILDKIILDIEKNRLSDKNIKISLSDELKKYIVDNSYDPAFGARPLKRFIADTIELTLAKGLIDGAIKENSKVNLDIKDGKIVF